MCFTIFSLQIEDTSCKWRANFLFRTPAQDARRHSGAALAHLDRQQPNVKTNGPRSVHHVEVIQVQARAAYLQKWVDSRGASIFLYFSFLRASSFPPFFNFNFPLVRTCVCTPEISAVFFPSFSQFNLPPFSNLLTSPVLE